MNDDTRAEWDREIYDHERMTGQHGEDDLEGFRFSLNDEDPQENTLATFTIQVLGPPLTEIETRFSQADKRVLANLPAMLESVEEDLTSLLPPGYEARIREWSSDA